MAFKPFREHAFVYQFQDFEFRRQSLTAPTRAVDRSTLAAPIDHYVRIWQLVALIEMLFAIIRRERPGETIRWLDLGCGMGDAVNCVRLEDCLHDENWEIVGVDWNESGLRIAKKDAGPRRKFLVGDVEAAIGQVGAESFNIISAFEFIEHLEDPVKSLKRYSPLCSDFFVAGSPLAERQHWLPAATHIWTFDRRGFEETLLAAGFAASFVSEAYVGKYASGHDWVTVIAGARRKLPRSITMHGSG